MKNVFVHLYGKTQTKPGRKMGHVTVMSADKNDLIEKVQTIKEFKSNKLIKYINFKS